MCVEACVLYKSALTCHCLFLNDHVIDVATAVIDFQKSVCEVCITGGQKRNKPKKALTPQKYL